MRFAAVLAAVAALWVAQPAAAAVKLLPTAEHFTLDFENAGDGTTFQNIFDLLRFSSISIETGGPTGNYLRLTPIGERALYLNDGLFSREYLAGKVISTYIYLDSFDLLFETDGRILASSVMAPVVGGAWFQVQPQRNWGGPLMWSEGVHLDNLSFTRIVEVGALPEPSTWALMILGLGAVGAMMRRNHAVTGVKSPPEPAFAPVPNAAPVIEISG